MQEINRLDVKQQMKGFLGAIPVCGLLTICLEVGLAFLHRGGSVKNHLIHFAILLLAAEGMVLLYGAVPSVRQIVKRIDRQILSVEIRKPWVDITYAALAMIMLLHHFYVLLYYPTLPTGATRFAPLWIPFAVVTVLMGKLWRNKGFWIGTVLAAYLFERTYLKEPNISGETMVYMVFLIYALVLCYGVFHVIREEYRRGVLRVLCAIWTLATLAFCFAGLYFAWTGEPVQNLADGKTELFEMWGDNARQSRLCIFSNSTTTGGIIAGGTVFALAGFAVAKKTIGKIAYLVACIPMLLTNVLTDTRSTILMLSFAVAAMVTLGVWGLLKGHVSIHGRANVLLAAGLVICLAGCFILTLTGQRALKNQFVEIRNKGGLVVTSAQAEDSKTEKAKPLFDTENRSVIVTDADQVGHLLNGRWDIWGTAFNYVKEHPETIAFGLSADGTVKEAINRDDHCHNIVIQMFMEGGIIGLGLFLGLLGYFFFHACRLWRRWDLSLWQRALPVPALAVLLMEMVECLTHFAYGHVPMTVLYFFIGATVAVSRGLRNNNQKEMKSIDTN